MAGQVTRRLPPEHRVPASPKVTDVEITKARNLDVECLPVRRGRTDSYAWHGGQEDRRLERRDADLLPPPLSIWYIRSPSTFFEASFSLRRLRTTPAKKPRTECCCQPVAFITAVIVVPERDRSIAM